MASEAIKPAPEAGSPSDRSGVHVEPSAPEFKSGFHPDGRLPARDRPWPGLPGGVGFQSPERIVMARYRQAMDIKETRRTGTPMRPGFVPPVPLPDRKPSDQWIHDMMAGKPYPKFGRFDGPVPVNDLRFGGSGDDFPFGFGVEQATRQRDATQRDAAGDAPAQPEVRQAHAAPPLTFAPNRGFAAGFQPPQTPEPTSVPIHEAAAVGLAPMPRTVTRAQSSGPRGARARTESTVARPANRVAEPALRRALSL